MHGANLSIVAVQCVVCKKFVAIRVDLEDLARWRAGAHAQDAMPYVSCADRELLCLSKVCPACWDLLCPDPITHPTAYN